MPLRRRSKSSPADDTQAIPLDSPPASPEVTLKEEELDLSVDTRPVGTVKAKKRVESEPFQAHVQRGVEHADLESLPPQPGDTGQVETLPDGSISIPIFEERIVVEKRLVVVERVILRKHTVYEDHLISADLKKERLDIQTEGDAPVSTSP